MAEHSFGAGAGFSPTSEQVAIIDAEAVDLLELWAEIEDAAKAIQGLSSEPIL